MRISGVNRRSICTSTAVGGPGMVIRPYCFGCDKWCSPLGGKGKHGVRWRCAECVAKTEAKQ